MKKLLTISLMCCLTMSVMTQVVEASTTKVSPTDMPSVTASPSAQNTELMNKIDEQLNTLKEKIASRVAELNLVEKRGIIGTVSDVNGTEIKVTDIHNDIRFIDVDELTKFSSPDKSNFGISDITKGTLLGILGDYNKDSRRILARFVDVVSFPQVVIGTIGSIDKQNYQFTISKSNGKSQLIDVEAFTKTSSYTNANGTIKSGFSKLNTGDQVYIIGYPDKKDPTMIVSSRTIILQDLSSATTQTTTPTPTKSK